MKLFIIVYTLFPLINRIYRKFLLYLLDAFFSLHDLLENMLCEVISVLPLWNDCCARHSYLKRLLITMLEARIVKVINKFPVLNPVNQYTRLLSKLTADF